MNQPLSAEQKRELFLALDKAKAKVITEQKKLDEAVANISDHVGDGPFRWNGEEFSIVNRGDRKVLRTRSNDVQEIE